MTDAQLLTMALAVIIPLSMLLYSNSRITEAKETLRAEMEAVRADMGTMMAKILSEIHGLRAELKIQRTGA